MLSLENLLVVLVDGRDAQPAWGSALAWGVATGARIHVFLPVTTSAPRGLELEPGLQAAAEQGAGQDGVRWLDSWLCDAPANTTRTIRATGKWCEAVLHEARRQEAGLLVLSADAVTSKELHQLLPQLPCPLYLARRGKAPLRLAGALAAAVEDATHKLLNEVVLEHLAMLARQWQAEPVLLSAMPNPAELIPLMGDTYIVGDVTGEVEQGYRQSIAAQAKPMGLDQAPLLAQLGRPDLVIPLLVKEGNIDCLLLGMVPRQALAAFWLGSTAEDLLLHIDCDALVLRPQDYYDPS